MKKAFIIKRILYAIFIFFVVLTLNFFIPRMGVDDPAERYYPPQGNMSEVEYEIIKQVTKEQYGFDVSPFKQYTNYVKGLAKFDLGVSFQSGNPRVGDLILDRLPWTLVLSVSNMVIGLGFGIVWGTLAARKRGRWQDTTLLNLSTITVALPAFFLALLFSFYFGFELELFPAYTNPNMVSQFTWSWESIKVVMYNAALPIISMAIGSIIGNAQGTRNSVISVTNEDFVLTARAKGLSENKVLFKHTLRNALLPIVTSVGMGMAGLIGGAVIIEQIFNWNGMGTLFLEANNTNDYPLMMGIMLFISTIAIVANLIVELTYSLLDPRVTVGERR